MFRIQRWPILSTATLMWVCTALSEARAASPHEASGRSSGGFRQAQNRTSGPDGAATASEDSFPLVQISQISPAQGKLLVFGDTDHDGRNEVILNWRDGNFVCCSYRILEEQGNNVYTEEYRSAVDLFPMWTGDLDGDGKAEILGQFSNELRIYESVDSTSHPTQLVWTLVTSSNVLRFTTAGDTDRDGKMEIVHNLGSYLLILENSGDNTFDQVYLEFVTSGGGGEQVIADLDGDGLVEIAFADVAGGRALVYESTADNTWVQTWADSTELDLPRSAEGGSDTDGNGRPELFVMGNTFVGGTAYWTTIVYEATCDNQFARVTSFSRSDGANGVTYNGLGNLDGLGADEYLMDGQCCLWIYQACAPGQWSMVQEIPDPSFHAGPHVFDVNGNGRSEVFWTTDGLNLSTLVLESPFSVSDVDNGTAPRTVPLSILPNPCRTQAVLRVADTSPHTARLAVFDAAGRLVERRVLLKDVNGQLLWSAQHAPSGVYFLRLEDQSGAPLATGRAVVAR